MFDYFDPMADDLPDRGRKQYPLVRCADGQWVETEPDACPNGHPLRPGTVQRGWTSCRHDCSPGGHRTWTCRECGAEIADPPHIGPPHAERWRINDAPPAGGNVT